MAVLCTILAIFCKFEITLKNIEMEKMIMKGWRVFLSVIQGLGKAGLG